jgi:hypothetical protein
MERRTVKAVNADHTNGIQIACYVDHPTAPIRSLYSPCSALFSSTRDLARRFSNTQKERTMKTYLKLTILLTIAALVYVDRGLALPLHFDDNVASDTLIENRQSLAGRFDIRSKIKSFRAGSTDRYFNRGTLHFAFTDDNDLTGAGYFHSRWERKLIGNIFHYERRQYNIFRDPFELIQIKALGKTAYKYTEFYKAKEKSDLPDKMMNYDSWGPFDASYRTEFYNSVIGWGGDMTYSMALDDYWLTQISTTGILPYDLRAVMGDMILRTAVLELEANPQAAPVPEPSTFLLILTSAGLVGGGSKLRKLFSRVRSSGKPI